MKTIHGKGLGWHSDLPDFRDHTLASPTVSKVLAKSAPLKKANAAAKLPSKVDLRQYCSPIDDQGQLNSCTAHAGTAMYEYFEQRAFGKYVDASRLFLYKVSRQLLQFEGDSGAYIRDTMKAMVLFGLPPEKYWPYDIKHYDADPNSFCFSFAQNYQAIDYYRLDPPSTAPKDLLVKIKTNLAAELPAMFGFSVYSSIPPVGDTTGNIPFPGKGDTLEGGHAVLAVGYDDTKKIGTLKGALLIRNSWGTAWGEAGYGWLPYAYVEQGLAQDFWSMVKGEFVDTDLFNKA